MRPITRRTVLRGAGAALALPWLDAMWPRAFAAPAVAPKRLCFVCIPNGAHMADWTPKTEGADFALPWILEPLAPLRAHVSVLTGLAHDKARAHGDGPGDHARSAATFLTGAQAVKTAGADIRVGISVDQLVARQIGAATRFPSLELGCEPARQSGDCDSGYSCAYSSTIAWRTPHTPVAHEVSPRQVFERLFLIGPAEEGPEARAQRLRVRGSVLDLVAAEATALRQRLGVSDRRKLEEYQDSVREIERRVEQAAGAGTPGDRPAAPPDRPADFTEHQRLMYDLIVLAFRLDLTRVATFMVGNEGSNRNYGFIGAPGGHHEMSHHGKDPEKQERIRVINRYHMIEFARFLAGLAAVREGEGTLLDATAVVYGSAIGDGDRHNHDDLPVLVAGGLGGTLSPGRHLRTTGETPMCNLFVSLCERVGVPAPSFGDSTGALRGI